MKSFNCFYSALFDILETQYYKNTNLLINNRWQFFYNSENMYSDDKRIIGEYPLPFDKMHIELLSSICDINIHIKKATGGLNDVVKIISNSNGVIVFANKYILNGLYKKFPDKKCVTTIRIDRLQNNMIHYSTYDNDMSFSKIEISLFTKAWRDASEHIMLNESIVDVSMSIDNNSTLQSYTAKNFFWKNIISSIDEFLNSQCTDNIYSGYSGLNKFALAIDDGKLSSYSKLLDCSMYLQFIISQRECIKTALESINTNNKLNTIVNTIKIIIDYWKKIKIYFYIVGKREQYESMKYLSNEIRTIAQMEYKCLNDLKKITGEVL